MESDRANNSVPFNLYLLFFFFFFGFNNKSCSLKYPNWRQFREFPNSL